MKKQVAKTKKEMTITEVGTLVLGLVDKVNEMDVRLSNKIDVSVNHLAEATAKGFTEVHESIRNVENSLENKIDELRVDMNENFGKVRHDILIMKDTFVTKDELHSLL